MKMATRRRRAGFQLAVAVFFLQGLAGAEAAMPQARSLSLTQIEKLIQIRTPDAAVAQEVRSRGLDFTATPKILEELQRRGAGQATLAAVRERMPIGTLEIQAPSGSQVVVDGTDRGITDTQGSLVLPNMPAGDHQIMVKKQGYLTGSFKLMLAAREYKRLSAKLDWTGGFLTVLPNASGVFIEVERMGRFSDQVQDLPCLPGTYKITVSGPKYLVATKRAEIATGQHATVSFALGPDPQFVRNAESELQRSFDSRNYSQVISSAQELLPLDAKNKDALRLLAQSYFLTNQFEKFEAAANGAIDAGGAIQIQLNHHHAMGAAGLHPVILSIASGFISFDPQTSARAVCNYKAFTNPVAAIFHLEVTRNKRDEVYFNLKTSDPKNPKKILNFNFTDLESHFVEAQKEFGGMMYTGQLLVSRPEAQQALASFAKVLKRVAPKAE